MLFRTGAMLCLTALLAGCAVYQPDPLPTHDNLAKAPALPAQMTLAEVTARAIRDNPTLIAARQALPVATARVALAGLPPNPQIGLSLDHPTSGGNGLFNAYNINLTEDLAFLLTRSDRLDAAKAEAAGQRLLLQWQTWQLVGQVQSDYLSLWFDQQRLALLDRELGRYTRLRNATRHALDAGYITLDTAAGVLVTLTQTQAKRAQLEQRLSEKHIALNALLGLAPTVRWTLSAPQLPALPTPAAVTAALNGLPDRRPDLLALQAGYASSDARYRAALLGQFPAINIGLTGARDTSNVHTSGLGIGLSFPLFDGNRHAIAEAKASRSQLKADYQARLDAAVTAVQRLMAHIEQVQQRNAELDRQLPELNRMAEQAQQAFNQGNLTAAANIAIQDNRMARALEQLDARQTLASGALSLQILLGQLPPPPAAASRENATP